MPSENHPQVDWENRYQAEDTPWDKGTHHPMAAAMMAAPVLPGTVLAPGCGTGWDLLALAECLPDRKILGVDIAPFAVDSARRRTAGFPMIEVRCIDIFSPGIRDCVGPVAMIWEHTCFCAIPPAMRPAYVAMAADLLPPGGELRGVFFLTLDDEGSGPPWNCPGEELRSLFGPWFEIASIELCATTHPGREHSEWHVHMRRKDV